MPEHTPAEQAKNQGEVAPQEVLPEQAPIDAAPQRQDVTQKIEEGLSQLPADTQEILAAFSVAPEFAQLMGELVGPEIGQFFAQFADPEMALVAVPRADLDSVMSANEIQGTDVDQAQAEDADVIEELPAV